jgi:hypothetical protein
MNTVANQADANIVTIWEQHENASAIDVASEGVVKVLTLAAFILGFMSAIELGDRDLGYQKAVRARLNAIQLSYSV